MNQMMLALIVASNLVVILRERPSANRVNEVLTVESQLTDTPESAKHLHNLVILPLTM